MADGADDLLEAAREELYHARVLVRGLRNRTKTDAAALFDSEQRIAELISKVELRLNGSPGPKEAHGHDSKLEAQAH